MIITNAGIESGTNGTFVPAMYNDTPVRYTRVRSRDGSIWSSRNYLQIGSRGPHISWERIYGTPNSSGYLVEDFVDGGGRKMIGSLHRLVASTIMPPRWNGLMWEDLEVHHRDHDRTNYRPNNLEWLTTAQHESLHRAGTSLVLSELYPSCASRDLKKESLMLWSQSEVGPPLVGAVVLAVLVYCLVVLLFVI